MISPNNGGGQNWAPPTFDPDTSLIYLNTAQGYEIHYQYDIAGTAYGSAGHISTAVGGLNNALRAIDYHTGEAKWIHVYAGSQWNPERPEHMGGLLSTAGNLLFAGAPGGFMVAYDPKSGRQLWHVALPDDPSNTPITYMLNGRQYLTFASGDSLYSFTMLQ